LRVQGTGSGVSGGFRVYGSGTQVQGLGITVEGDLESTRAECRGRGRNWSLLSGTRFLAPTPGRTLLFSGFEFEPSTTTVVLNLRRGY